MTDLNEKALKPCPFCGSKAEIERYGGCRQSTIYRCTVCSCSLETGEEWDHGSVWNRRADLPPGYAILSPDEVRGMERDRQAVEFAARWCWRTDPPNAHNKLTDAERLSVIKHHPTIKQYGQPHIELAEREGLLKGGRDAQ